MSDAFQKDNEDGRAYALATLAQIIDQIEAGDINGLIVAAEGQGGMQFFTTYDARHTIGTAALINHWAIARVLGEQFPTPGTLQ